MLREVAHVSQLPDEGPRRCFADAQMHLLVWYEDNGGIHGFELTCEGASGPRAVRWQPGNGLSHSHVIDREPHRFIDASALLVPCEEPVSAEVMAEFHAGAGKVPRLEREFVEAKLAAALSSG